MFTVFGTGWKPTLRGRGEREERINTQPAFAKLSVPSNQYFFEPTTLSNNRNVLVALFGVFPRLIVSSCAPRQFVFTD